MFENKQKAIKSYQRRPLSEIPNFGISNEILWLSHSSDLGKDGS